MLLVAVLFAVLAVIYTVGNLGFQPNRNDLINPALPWNQRFIDWQASFLAANQLYVVVDGAADQAAARAVIDELGPALADSEAIEHIAWGFDAARFHPRAIRLLPPDLFEQRLAEIAEAKPLLENADVGSLLTGIASRLQQDQPTDGSDAVDQLDGLIRLADALTLVVATPLEEPIDFSKHIEAQSAETWQYLTSNSGNLYFVALTPHFDQDQLNPLGPALEAIRDVIARVQANHPDTHIGLTGIEVIEADETDIATRDSTRASVIAGLLIAGLLIAAFHSIRVPMITMAALLIGIAWSFGFLTFAVGHLQVLSVVFAVILLGLGVDFGLHLISGFELVRHNHPPGREGFAPAMVESFHTVGPGIITGAVTTAAAFGTTVFTDFTGVAEMGKIAAGGILLCLVAMTSVFPALLRVFKPAAIHLTPMDDRWVHVYDDRWVMPFVRHPRITAVMTLGLAIVCGAVAMQRMKFDYDLMELQPRGVESVDLVRRVADEGGASIYYGVSFVNSLDEARTLATTLTEKQTVSGEFGGIGLLIPPAESEKLKQLTQLRTTLGDALPRAVAEGVTPSESDGKVVSRIAGMRFALTAALQQNDIAPDIAAKLNELASAMDRFLAASGKLDAAQRAERLDRLNRLYSGYRYAAALRITSALGDEPMQLGDLPPQLLDPYTDANGRMAMLVYPQLPDDASYNSPMDPRFLPGFVNDLLAVDDQATGNAVQFYLSGELIRTAYLRAGVFALIVVFVLVWLDFQSIVDAMLTLLPVAVGFAVTFAVMSLCGMQINAANIIVLPLMFGIGVDAGVHVLHRFKQSPQLDPPGLASGTGKGVTVTALTTMIGFGSLMLASHRGIWSIGFVMTLGIALTLAACWIVLPAILALRTRNGYH